MTAETVPARPDEPPAWPVPRLPVGPGTGALALAVIASVDAVLIAGWLLGDLGPLSAMGWHLGVVGATLLAGWLGRDAAHGGLVVLVVLAVLIAILGPVGGVLVPTALLLARLIRAVAGPQATLVAAGLRDLRDPAGDLPPRARSTLLVQAIRQGRRPDHDALARNGYAWVFAYGDASERQTAIGMLGRNFAPGMRPLLDAALTSPHPALRVQAAAVFAKLRGRFADRAEALLAAPSPAQGTPPAAAIAAEARHLAATQFLEPETERRLRLLADALDPATVQAARTKAAPAAPIPHAPPAAAPHDGTRPPRLKRHSCGGLA